MQLVMRSSTYWEYKLPHQQKWGCLAPSNSEQEYSHGFAQQTNSQIHLLRFISDQYTPKHQDTSNLYQDSHSTYHTTTSGLFKPTPGTSAICSHHWEPLTQWQHSHCHLMCEWAWFYGTATAHQLGDEASATILVGTPQQELWNMTTTAKTPQSIQSRGCHALWHLLRNICKLWAALHMVCSPSRIAC